MRHGERMVIYVHLRGFAATANENVQARELYKILHDHGDVIVVDDSSEPDAQALRDGQENHAHVGVAVRDAVYRRPQVPKASEPGIYTWSHHGLSQGLSSAPTPPSTKIPQDSLWKPLLHFHGKSTVFGWSSWLGCFD